MVTIGGEIKRENLTRNFYFVGDRDLVVLAHVEELQLLVEATSDHSIPNWVVANPGRWLLEGVEAGTMLKNAFRSHLGNGKCVTMSDNELIGSALTEILDRVIYSHRAESLCSITEIPNFDGTIRRGTHNTLGVQVAHSFNVIRMCRKDGQVRRRA